LLAASPCRLCRGEQPFSRGHICKLLSNPLHVGEIAHKGTRYPGQHPAIIDAETWEAVQRQLAANTQGRCSRPNVKEGSLLSGLLFDEKEARLIFWNAMALPRRTPAANVHGAAPCS
jgi:hypothetical protein